MLLQSNGNTFHLDDLVSSIRLLAAEQPVNNGLLDVQAVFERNVFGRKLRKIKLNQPILSASPDVALWDQSEFITPVYAPGDDTHRRFNDYKKLLEVHDIFGTKPPYNESEWKYDGKTLSSEEILCSLARQYQPEAVGLTCSLDLTPCKESKGKFDLRHPLQWIRGKHVCAEFQSITVKSDSSSLLDSTFFTAHDSDRYHSDLKHENPMWQLVKSYKCTLVIATHDDYPDDFRYEQFLRDQEFQRLNYFDGFVA